MSRLANYVYRPLDEEGLCKRRFLRSARISVTVDPFFYDE